MGQYIDHLVTKFNITEVEHKPTLVELFLDWITGEREIRAKHEADRVLNERMTKIKRYVRLD